MRIEDIDPPRERAGSGQGIIEDLARLGMESDGPVLFQSNRQAAYDLACEQLLRAGRAYWCGCSRKDLPDSGMYPGTCRNGIPPGKRPRTIRVRVGATPVGFVDRLQGRQSHNLLNSSGDFVIHRADGLAAYQLAVVVDDAFQKITEVVRGADLLDSTARQIRLQELLKLPTPGYLHVPVAVMPDGAKLSKRERSDPVRNQDPASTLRAALKFLGHNAPRMNLASTLNWAVENWSVQAIPRVLSRPAPLPAPG